LQIEVIVSISFYLSNPIGQAKHTHFQNILKWIARERKISPVGLPPVAPVIKLTAPGISQWVSSLPQTSNLGFDVVHLMYEDQHLQWVGHHISSYFIFYNLNR
jgi:hypothetical protein